MNHSWLLISCIFALVTGEKQRISFTIPENIPTYDRILGKISNEVDVNEDEVTGYKVLDDKHHLFDIVQTGYINLTKNVDRESICPSIVATRDDSVLCIYEATALIERTSNLDPIFITIRLTITDENDNAPIFESPIINKTISESAPIGSIIRLNSARDLDVGANYIDHYRLIKTDGDVPFVLKQAQSNFGLLIPEVKLTGALDREIKSHYSMVLRSYDGGENQKTGDMKVIIEVSDVNDNRPEFELAQYKVEVNESLPEGEQVLTVRATDKDHGKNSQIRYELQRAKTLPFYIDSKTGTIYLKEKLDYETTKTYHLSVVASDIGPNPQSDFADVQIDVVNTNDEVPQIGVNFMDFIELVDGEIPNRIYLSEDVEIGTQIAYVTLSDLGGEDVNCEIENDKEEVEQSGKDVMELHKLEENSYVLRTKTELDRELSRKIYVNLLATDKGVPPKTNRTKITIQLQDVNDNPPQFVSSVINIPVEENKKDEEQVYSGVLATDPDYKENKQITYKWEFIASNMKEEVNKETGIAWFDPSYEFEIQEDSGFINMGIKTMPLDAETQISWFLYNVTATDKGNPPLSSNALVNLTVVDSNDNSPRFVDVPENGRYTFQIREDGVNAQIIGQVKAIDDDIEKSTNGKVKYSFQKCPQTTCPFYIGTFDGKIRFDGKSQLIDREAPFAQVHHDIVVKAEDLGIPSRTLTTEIRINVVDINDNPLKIESPSYSHDSAYIVYFRTSAGRSTYANISSSHSSPAVRKVGYPLQIARIVTKDKDAASNHTFKVLKGDQSEKFRISRSGWLECVDLTGLTDGCHVINYQITDVGYPGDREIESFINVYVSLNNKPTNSTKVMEQCKSSAYFPSSKSGSDVDEDKMKNITLLVVIFSTILLILIIVMVVMIIKYKCRGTSKKTYNCKEATNEANLYHLQNGSTIRSHQQTTMERNSRMENYYTDENGRHIKQIDGKLYRENSSHNEGGRRDSGTGDSVPPSSQMMSQHAQVVYDDSDFYIDENSQLIYQQQPTIQHHHMLHQNPNYVMMTSQCTDECKINGCGDGCWMPNVAAEEYQVVKPRVGWMTPQPQTQQYENINPRFHHQTASPTPYYYDPVSNFEMTSPHPHYRQSPVIMSSQHPSSFRSASATPFMNHQQVKYANGKAYINLMSSPQFNDDVSSHSSHPKQYDALMTSFNNQHRFQQPSNNDSSNHDDEENNFTETENEDFAASNLIMTSKQQKSPVSNGYTADPDNKLSTIGEEINADEVIANIDGLLL